MRSSGILLPVASLPSKYGIGTFSKEAYHFIDQLKAAGQKYWQILPLGPTGYGDSPYQAFSTFAGNPYFIDLESLIEQGYLSKAECDAVNFGNNARYINYQKIYLGRFKLLKSAYGISDIEKNNKFNLFIRENEFWLEDYALYMAIKDYYLGKSWCEWDKDIRMKEEVAVESFRNKYQYEINFYKFLQFIFIEQWLKLKEYANKQGIKIIGDIPIYVALDSSDAWAHPELFQFDENKKPITVAGCPPDDFSPKGQLWGNPTYNWEYHKNTDYQWWIERISYCFKLYDTVRVDHFRGFDEYYSIPVTSVTAEVGTWEKGPGYDIFEAIKNKLGEVDIIAEDLGFLTESVGNLLKQTGYPGMKVLQFAFSSDGENDYMPHNYDKNCVVYTGTHDNETTVGWYKNLKAKDKELVKEYLDINESEEKDINWKLIRLALSSIANLAILPLQDYLGLDNRARINVPSTIGSNWTWRLLEDEFTEDLVKKIYKLTKLYGR